MKRILILGGGFGGITVATELGRLFDDQHQITLVDRDSKNLFLQEVDL